MAMASPMSVLMNFLYPKRCLFCGELLAADVQLLLCPRCYQKHSRWFGNTVITPQGFHCVYSVHYGSAVRSAFLRFKFYGAEYMAKTFARLMLPHIAQDRHAEVVTWVPMRAWKVHKRGYNQSELLARQLAVLEQLPAQALLRKVRKTQTQSLLGRAERRRNVRGAYACTDPDAVAGKNVLLVDDVVTSGATIGECAEILRVAGARTVTCVAFAHRRYKRMH